MPVIELDILKYISKLSSPAMDFICKYFSTAGNSGIIWIFCALLMLFVKQTRRIGITALIAMAIGALVSNLILKPLVCRPRPFSYVDYPLIISAPSDWSFPSGHTTAAFAFASAVGAKFGKKSGLVYVAAAFMGFTRLYLFVHFLTDVIAGLAIGVLAGAAANVIVKRFCINPKNRFGGKNG